MLGPDGEIAALIKPQFEAGRAQVGKKGVVKDPKVHFEVVKNILTFAAESGLAAAGLSYSPIKGPEGNIEYLAYLQNSGGISKISDADIHNIIDASHARLSGS